MRLGWLWLAFLLVSLQAVSQETLVELDARLAALGRAQRWTEALPLAQHMVEVARRTRGEESAELATCLNNLGAVQSQLGQSEQAIENLRSAVKIREKVLGPDHLLTALALYSLGNVYQSIGAYAKAEDALLRCLSIRQLRLGSDHPDTRAVLHHLAIVSQSHPTPPPVEDGLVAARDPMEERMAIDEYRRARRCDDDHDYAQAAAGYEKCLEHAMAAWAPADLEHANFGGQALGTVARRALEVNLTVLRGGGPARQLFRVHKLYRQLETLEPHNPSWFYLDAQVWAAAGNAPQSRRLLSQIQGQGSPRLQAKVRALQEQLAPQGQFDAARMEGVKSAYAAGAWLPPGGNASPHRSDIERRAEKADPETRQRLLSGRATCADLERVP